MPRLVVPSRIILGLMLVLSMGCGSSPPPPSDPVKGKALLVNALDAWKRGESLDAYRKATPTVTVADRQWEQGVRLLNYELTSEGKPEGFDVQFTVKLSLDEKSPKKGQEKTLYAISTAPAQVIVRLEGQ